MRKIAIVLAAVMSDLVWLSATQMRRKGPFRSSRPNRKVRLLATTTPAQSPQRAWAQGMSMAPQTAAASGREGRRALSRGRGGARKSQIKSVTKNRSGGHCLLESMLSRQSLI